MKNIAVQQPQSSETVPSREQIGTGYFGFKLPQKLTNEGQIQVDRLVKESLTLFKGLSAQL